MSQILLKVNSTNEMIVWFYYTQRSEPLQREYNVRFKFMKDGLYIGGFKNDVELAVRKFEKLTNVDYRYEILQTFNVTTAKYIQPYYELINNQEYQKLRQQDQSTCVITSKKFHSLCKGLFGRFDYRPMFELPRYFVFFYSRADLFDDFKRKVLLIVSEIGNSLVQNITPLGISKYNGWSQSAEGMNFFAQSIVLNIRLFDAIWYFKFIDLKRFEILNKVKLSIQKSDQYLLKISSYDQDRAIQTKDYIINDLQQRCLTIIDFVKLATNNYMLHYLATFVKEKIKSQKVKLYSPDTMIKQANELDQQFFMDEAYFCQEITGQLKSYKMPVFLFCHPKDKDRILDIFNNLLDLKGNQKKLNSTYQEPHDLLDDQSYEIQDKVMKVMGKSILLSQFSILNFNDPCPEYDEDEDEIKISLSQKFQKRHEIGNYQYEQKQILQQSQQYIQKVQQSDDDKQSFLNQSLKNRNDMQSLSQSSIQNQSVVSSKRFDCSQIIQKPQVTQLKNYNIVNDVNGFSIVFYTCQDGQFLLSETFQLDHFQAFWKDIYRLAHAFIIISQTNFIKFEIEFKNDDKIPQDKLEIINGLDQYFNSTIYVVSLNLFDDVTLKKMEQKYNCSIKPFKTSQLPGFYEGIVKEDLNGLYFALKIYHLMRSNIQAFRDDLVSEKYFVQMNESQFIFAQQRISIQKVCISKNYLNYFWVQFQGPKGQLQSILNQIYQIEIEKLSKVQEQYNLREKNNECEYYEITNKDNYCQYWMNQLQQIHNLILDEQELKSYKGPKEQLVVYTNSFGQLYTGIAQLTPGKHTLTRCVMIDKIPKFQDTNCLLIEIIIKL